MEGKEASVQLVLAEKKLHFKSGEQISIPLRVISSNIGTLENIQYQWTLYRNGVKQFTKVTSTNSTVVGIHQMYAGHQFKVELLVIGNKKPFCLNEKGMFMNWDNMGYNFIILPASIEFTPTCEKRVTSVEWYDKNTNIFYSKKLKDGEASDVSKQEFLLQGNKFSLIGAVVYLIGYNYQEVVVHREVVGVNDQIAKLFKKIEPQTIIDGSMGVSFNCNLLRLNLKPCETRTATAVIKIQESKQSTKIIADFRCKLKVTGNNHVEKIDSFPIQPTIVGSINIVENNYKPCKYTQIELEYTKEGNSTKLTPFDEGRSTQALPINIIGGKRKTTVTLRNYTTEKCTVNSDIHRKATFDALPPIEIKDGKIELDLKYDYGKELEKTDMIKAWERADYLQAAAEAIIPSGIKEIFKYFLLPYDVIQLHKLQVTTCRHSNALEINMIPDVKWDFHVGFGRAYPDYSQLKTPIYNSKKSIRQQEKEAANARAGLLEGLEFEVGLSAEYNDGQTIDMKNSVVKRVKNASEKVEKVMGWFQLDRFFKFKDDNAKKEFNKQVRSDKEAISYSGRKPGSSKFRAARLPIPVFMEMGNPTLFVGGTWQYDINSSNQLSRKGSVYIELDPLIQVKAGVDLIACAQYIPVVGNIITAIIKGKDALETATEWVSNGNLEARTDLWFNIYIEGKIKAKGELEISDDDTRIALKLEATITFGVELGIKCSINAKTVTIKSNKKTTTKISAELGIEAKVEASFTATPSAGYSSSEGLFVDVELQFDGVVLNISGTAKIEKKSEEKEQVPTKKGKVKEEVEHDGWSTEKNLDIKDYELMKGSDPINLHFSFPGKEEK